MSAIPAGVAGEVRVAWSMCVGRQVVQCNPDYNYGPVIQNCATINMNCSGGACR